MAPRGGDMTKQQRAMLEATLNNLTKKTEDLQGLSDYDLIARINEAIGGATE